MANLNAAITTSHYADRFRNIMNITSIWTRKNGQNQQLRAFADNLNISGRRDLTGLSSLITSSTSARTPVVDGNACVDPVTTTSTTAANGGTGQRFTEFLFLEFLFLFLIYFQLLKTLLFPSFFPDFLICQNMEQK